MKEGWTYKKLGEVARVQNGFAFDSKFFNEKGDGTPLIRIRDIKRAYSETFTTESCSDDYIIEDGNILIGMDGDFNVCSWAGGHAFLNQRVCRVISSEKLLPRFIYYLLPFPLKRINEKTSFSTVKHLSSKQVNNIIIPVPPLPEQRAIVARLDSAFAQIDSLKANAEKQLSEARKLFQKALEEAMTPKEGWEEKTLGEICEIKSLLVNPTEEQYKNLLHVGGANIVSLTGELIDLKTAEEDGLESGKFTFDENDVLYNKIRPYLIKVARPDFFGLCSADMYPLTPKESIKRDYLYYVLISKDFTEYAILNSGRAGMPKVNRQALFAYRCLIPPLSTQHSIVAHLDSLSSHVRALEAKLKKMKDECDALKQAMLREVFE